MAAVTAMPEEIWAILRENAAQMKAFEEKAEQRQLEDERRWQHEFERRRQEAEERQKEFEQRQQEAEQQRQKETEQRQREAEQRQKEAEQRQQEFEQRQQKAEQQRQREAEERQQEAERRRQEAEQQQQKFERQSEKRQEEFKQWEKKWDKILKRNSKQMGELHNKFGKLAEHLVAPGIVKRFNELGYKFERIAEGNLRILDEQGKIKTEIDMLLENGDYIIAVEVKVKPAEKDVEHHQKRMEILREHIDKRHDTRKIRGAIAGAIFGPQEKKAVLEAGFYVIEQSGDTMKLDIPEGFVPGEW